ncbi:MAG: hypothetical protein H6825_06175 [Planctomycetes bacterium]|nr:hypothetical protein [Planctomycetota bacterium]
MRVFLRLLTATAVLLPFATSLDAQVTPVQMVRRGVVPAVPLETLPALPKFTASSPRTTIVFADRAPVGERTGALPIEQASAALLVSTTIPSSETGTGKQEPIQYQLPSSPSESPYPLIVAYHGFGNSVSTTAAQTVIDEYCELYGWAFLAVTGIDDKLFGSPVSQQNTEAAIEWMLAHSDADPDRIYMVGFSMGAGVVTNFAARHRDPDGVMIAAVATVSGSFDWTMCWTMDPTVQSWLLNPWNFGASPASDPFAYQFSSALYFDPSTYPPVPGTHDPLYAMARNLVDTPVYATWDTADTITYLPSQNAELVAWLGALGSVASRTVSDTEDPSSGGPATHSWAVMDPDELFGFFDGKSVERRPASFSVLAEEDRAVSWIDLVQETPGAFSEFDGSAFPDTGTLWVNQSSNLASATVDLVAAGLDGASPLHLQAASTDGLGTRIGLTGLAHWPGYALDTGTGDPLDGLEWDAATRTLFVPVPAWGAIDVEVPVTHWGATLTVTPDPVDRGQDFSMSAAARPGASALWLILGLSEVVVPLGVGTVFVQPWPPSLLLPLPLDGEGTVSFSATMPDMPELEGLRLLFQGAVVTSGQGLTDLTNPVALDVQ